MSAISIRLPALTSSRRSAPTRRGRAAIFRCGRCSATPICTQRFPWTPARRARGSDRARPIASAKGEEIIGLQRPAGKAVAPARFPGCRGSLRQYGILRRFPGGKAGNPRRTRRAANGMKWSSRARAQRPPRHRHHLCARQVPTGDYIPAGQPRLPVDVAEHHRGGRGGQ